jgi:hypothetical protein
MPKDPANDDLPAAWRSRGGEYILIKEMNTRHLLNAIRLLSRQATTANRPHFAALCAEASRRRLDLTGVPHGN